MTSRKLGLLFACTTALCWAVLAIALKFSLQYASSGTIVWFRMLVAFVVLGAILFFGKRDEIAIFKTPPLLAILAGLFLAANYVGFMKCVELTTASNAQIMIQMAPMSLVLIGVFYFKETPSLRQAIGILLASCGFLFFYWDQISLAMDYQERFVEGNLWVLMAAATWALFAAFQKILTRKWGPQQLNLLIYGVSALVLWPIADFAEFAQWSPWVWVLMIALGLNTILAYGALGEALKRTQASHVSLIISVNPLLTLFLIHMMERFQVSIIAPEPIEWSGYLGALFVVGGVSLTVLKRSKKKKSNQQHS